MQFKRGALEIKIKKTPTFTLEIISKVVKIQNNPLHLRISRFYFNKNHPPTL
jgi:hypothetical protein